MPVSSTIENKLPRVLVLADQKQLAHIEGLCKRANDFPAVTSENVERANDLLTQIKQWDISIEQKRKELKAPVLALGKEIDAAAKSATGLLGPSRRQLAGSMGAFDQAQKRKREAEIAKAKAEQQRREAERQEREAKRQEALRLQEERERALAEADEQDAVVEVPPPVVVPEPVPEPEPVAVFTPEPVKTSARRRTTVKVVVDDASKIPYKATPSGEPLYSPSLPAIKKALQAGVDVPGCRLETVESYS